MPRPWANAISACSRSIRARLSSSRGPASAMARRAAADSNAPAWSFACAASQCALASGGRGLASALSRARGTRPPPRCRREPGPARPNARVPRRRPRRARARPGRDARLGDRDRRRRRSTRPAPDAPPVGRTGMPPGRPPSARAGVGTAPGCRAVISSGASACERRRRRRRSPAVPAARRSNVTSPTGSAAAVKSRRRVSAGSDWTRRRNPCSIWLDRGRASEPAKTAGQLRCGQPAGQLEQRQRVAARLGQDAVAHPLVERTVDDRVEESPGVACSGRPLTSSSGRPDEVSPAAGSRTAKTSTTDSASSRRATKPKVRADALIQPLRVVDEADQRLGSRRRRRAGSVSPGPTRNRSGASPVRRPNAVASASRCGSGRCVEVGEQRGAQLVQAGVGQLHLGLDAGGSHRCGIRRHARPGTSAARSCRSRPRRAGPRPHCARP